MVRHGATSSCSGVERLVIGIAATIQAKARQLGLPGFFVSCSWLG
jgi:hypothetical protein